MTKDLLDYYENRFEMTATPGWAQLLEDVQKMRDAYSNIGGISTLENLHYKKGQLDILDWILSLRTVSEEAYKQLQEDGN